MTVKKPSSPSLKPSGFSSLIAEHFIPSDLKLYSSGLIEGAHEGLGLGTRFLGHVERTNVILHLIDCTHDDIVDAYRTVRKELKEYGHDLDGKEEIIALNKIDALGEELAEDQAKILEEAVGKKVHKISAVAGEGVQGILYELGRIITEARAGPVSTEYDP